MEKRLQYIAEDVNNLLDRSEISVQTEADRETLTTSPISRAGGLGRVVYVKDSNKRYKFIPDTQTWVEITTKVDDVLSEISENPVQNKVITNRVGIIEKSIANNSQSISTLTEGLGEANGRIDTNLTSIEELKFDFERLEMSLDQKSDKETYKSYTIPTTGWSELIDKNSYKYQTMITTSYDVTEETEIGLVVDDLSLYSKYGFGVGQVDGLNIYIWAVDKPDTEVTIMIGFRG